MSRTIEYVFAAVYKSSKFVHVRKQKKIAKIKETQLKIPVYVGFVIIRLYVTTVRNGCAQCFPIFSLEVAYGYCCFQKVVLT